MSLEIPNTYSCSLNSLPKNSILVIGTNPEGRHGAGIAKLGLENYGAKYGIAYGRTGNCYGIVTKNLTKNLKVKTPNGLEVFGKYGERSISLSVIFKQVQKLYSYAKYNPNLTFYIPYNFTGSKTLSGYSPHELASVFYFKGCPVNVLFHESILSLKPEVDTACYLKNDTVLSFWKKGHPFSNFYSSGFVWNNKYWHCAEQAIMWLKAMTFNDKAIASSIEILDDHPVEYKRLGRLVSGFNNKAWDKVIEKELFEILKAKFWNPYMCQYLLSVNKDIVEGSPSDTIYGAGVHFSDIVKGKPYTGKNLLGKTLEEVRNFYIGEIK